MTNWYETVLHFGSFRQTTENNFKMWFFLLSVQLHQFHHTPPYSIRYLSFVTTLTELDFSVLPESWSEAGCA